MGKWFDRLMAGKRSPIVVAWSSTIPDNTVYENVLYTLKQVRADRINLTVTLQNSFDDEFEVKIGVSNFSNKALGFGAAGVALIISSSSGTATYTSRCLKVGYPNVFDTPDLRNSDKPRKVVTVDAMKREDHLRAVFDPIPSGERVEVLIQANRIFAAPYLFRIPFEIEGDRISEASTPTQIRVNALARDLGVSAVAIIEYLPEIGVTEKKYLSSAIDLATAEKVRKHFRSFPNPQDTANRQF